MINAEKYKEELITLNSNKDFERWGVDKKTNKFYPCCGLACKNCVIHAIEDEHERKNYVGCNHARMKWMLSEYREPVKLTRLEYEILKHVQKEGFNFITRNNCGNSVIHEIKPIKHDGSIGWATTSKSYMLYAFNGLFKFVTSEDEKPTSIKEVLDNCIVENIKEEQ